MRVLQGHTDRVRAVSFAGVGARLASGGLDGTIRLWDARTGLELGRSDGLRPIIGLAVLPGDRAIVAAHSSERDAFSSGVAAVYPLAGNTIGRTRELDRGISSMVMVAVGISPDGAAVALAGLMPNGARRAVLVFSAAEMASWAEDGRESHRRERPGSRHAPITLRPSAALAWADGGMLCVSVAPEGRDVVAGTTAGEMIVWSIRPGGGDAERFVVAVPKALGSVVRSVAIRPDGTAIAAATGECVTLWERADGGRMSRWEARAALFCGEGSVAAVAFSPDGALLASGSYDGTVRLWEPVSGAEVDCWHGMVGRISCLAFAPDGMTLATGGERDIIIWDVGERI